jgi:hypothetical protein
LLELERFYGNRDCQRRMINRARPASFFWRTVFRLALLLFIAGSTAAGLAAQSLDSSNSVSTNPASVASGSSSSKGDAKPGEQPTEPRKASEPKFRIERLPLTHGAELLTIFGRLDGLRMAGAQSPEVPLISVVRDTLGDDTTENDRLRYVWMLTYTRPTLGKRIASAIPFFYQSVGRKTNVSGPPQPIIDLTNPRREAWKNFFWYGVQHAFFDTYGLPLKASSRSYRQNLQDYRTAHVAQALAILGAYQNLIDRTRNENEFLARRNEIASTTVTAEFISNGGDAAMRDGGKFSFSEMQELRARLLLSQTKYGGFAGPDQFHSTVEKYSAKSVDVSGHNWELLRQQAEAGGFYFEPLKMPDGTATHALLWISKNELHNGRTQDYAVRFLNITNPWTDKRLQNWKGYSQTWFFDSENRRTTSDAPDARPVEMIPVALYGLNHPKIPALLIDFRDSLNPKKREMSRRILNDVAKNVLSLSSFGNIPYFAGRKIYGFITGRRGMDLNQVSRVRSYSELKLLLALNPAIDPKLREELEQRLETVSLNPLSNNTDNEIELARKQYEAVIEYAQRENGLPAKIERDRRAEMTPLVHGPGTRFLFGLANVVSFGRYVHREKATPELVERMELARRVEYHTRFLQQVAKSSPEAEIVWNMNDVRASLKFLSDRSDAVKGSTAKAASQLFERTNDDETREMCLDLLSRIRDKTARNEMLRMYRQQDSQSAWRAALAERLRKSVAEDTRIKPAEAKAVLSEIGQP